MRCCRSGFITASAFPTILRHSNATLCAFRSTGPASNIETLRTSNIAEVCRNVTIFISGPGTLPNNVGRLSRPRHVRAEQYGKDRAMSRDQAIRGSENIYLVDIPGTALSGFYSLGKDDSHRCVLILLYCSRYTVVVYM